MSLGRGGPGAILDSGEFYWRFGLSGLPHQPARQQRLLLVILSH